KPPGRLRVPIASASRPPSPSGIGRDSTPPGGRPSKSTRSQSTTRPCRRCESWRTTVPECAPRFALRHDGMTGRTPILTAALVIGAILIGSMCEAAYRDTVLADSPILYWRLGESSGTTVGDSSGHGSTGTIVGSPTLGAQGALFGDSSSAVSF